MQGEKTENRVEQGADQPRWERVFFNHNRGYQGYRFQDFRAGCQHRDGEGNCLNTANEFGGGDDGLSLCLCDYCPCVKLDVADDDEADYSEGEQPILVIELPHAEPSPP